MEKSNECNKCNKHINDADSYNVYERYKYRWMASIDSLKVFTEVLTLLRNAELKRREPVEKHINNLNSNIKLACNIEEVAYKKYELAISELQVMSIVPCTWLPTFDKLKEIASKNI